MSTPIANLPTAGALAPTHLLIVEQQENGTSIETQKITLEKLYNWLSKTAGYTYNIKTNQVLTGGVNLSKTINTNDNTVILNYLIPEWSAGTYPQNSVVRYEGCLYISLINNSAPPTDTERWAKIGYKVGKHLSLSDDNILSGMGIDVWVAGQSYLLNDFVIKDKRLYQCLVANNDAEWDKNHWQNIGEGNGILTYENGKTYDIGSIVINENKLYKRLNTGADISWNSDNWLCISNGDYAQIFIKYSHVLPESNEDMIDEPAEYIGFYVGRELIAPTDYRSYTWYKIRGENGLDGHVNVEANTVVITMNLLAENWSDTAPFVQTINNEVITAGMYPWIDIALPDDETNWTELLEAYNCLTRAVAANGSINFYCIENKPEIDFSVKVRINGDVNANSFVTKAEFNEYKELIGKANNLLENTLGGY